MKYFFLLAIIGSNLLSLPTVSQAQEGAVPCENRPFTSATEREQVKRESPDCYALRTEFQTSGMEDAEPLQDISPVWYPDSLPTGTETAAANPFGDLLKALASYAWPWL